MPTFKSCFHPTQEMYKEYVRKVLCRKMRRSGFLLIGMAMLSCLIGILLSHTSFILIALFCLLFVTVTSTLTPNAMLKQLLTQNAERSKQTAQYTVVFDKNIRIWEGNAFRTAQYSQIQAIYRLKSCSVLVLSDSNGILYSEKEITGGSAVEFQTFLLGQCPQIKRIHTL